MHHGQQRRRSIAGCISRNESGELIQKLVDVSDALAQQLDTNRLLVERLNAAAFTIQSQEALLQQHCIQSVNIISSAETPSLSSNSSPKEIHPLEPAQSSHTAANNNRAPSFPSLVISIPLVEHHVPSSAAQPASEAERAGSKQQPPASELDHAPSLSASRGRVHAAQVPPPLPLPGLAPAVQDTPNSSAFPHSCSKNSAASDVTSLNAAAAPECVASASCATRATALFPQGIALLSSTDCQVLHLAAGVPYYTDAHEVRNGLAFGVKQLVPPVFVSHEDKLCVLFAGYRAAQPTKI